MIKSKKVIIAIAKFVFFSIVYFGLIISIQFLFPKKELYLNAFAVSQVVSQTQSSGWFRNEQDFKNQNWNFNFGEGYSFLYSSKDASTVTIKNSHVITTMAAHPNNYFEESEIEKFVIAYADWGIEIYSMGRDNINLGVAEGSVEGAKSNTEIGGAAHSESSPSSSDATEELKENLFHVDLGGVILGVAWFEKKIVALVLNESYTIDIVWLRQDKNAKWGISNVIQSELRLDSVVNMYTLGEVGIYFSTGDKIVYLSNDEKDYTILYTDAHLINILGDKNFYVIHYSIDKEDVFDVVIDRDMVFQWKDNMKTVPTSSSVFSSTSVNALVAVSQNERKFLYQKEKLLYEVVFP